MKTIKIITGKYQTDEILDLSPADVEAALRLFVATRMKQFETGWTVSVQAPEGAKIICSQWVGFTCQRCQSLKTTGKCKSADCGNPVCTETEQIKACCR